MKNAIELTKLGVSLFVSRWRVMLCVA